MNFELKLKHLRFKQLTKVSEHFSLKGIALPANEIGPLLIYLEELDRTEGILKQPRRRKLLKVSVKTCLREFVYVHVRARVHLHMLAYTCIICPDRENYVGKTSYPPQI